MEPMPTYGSPRSDIELWQCAKEQVDHRGKAAMDFAGQRMSELDAAKDFRGFGTWLAIAVRIASLGRAGGAQPH